MGDRRKKFGKSERVNIPQLNTPVDEFIFLFICYQPPTQGSFLYNESVIYIVFCWGLVQLGGPGPICRDFSVILKNNLAAVFCKWKLKYNLKQGLCIPAQIIGITGMVPLRWGLISLLYLVQNCQSKNRKYKRVQLSTTKH